eukprot:2606870-Rhodomonas_salina.1
MASGGGGMAVDAGIAREELAALEKSSDELVRKAAAALQTLLEDLVSPTPLCDAQCSRAADEMRRADLSYAGESACRCGHRRGQQRAAIPPGDCLSTCLEQDTVAARCEVEGLTKLKVPACARGVRCAVLTARVPLGRRRL